MKEYSTLIIATWVLRVAAALAGTFYLLRAVMFNDGGAAVIAFAIIISLATAAEMVKLSINMATDTKNTAADTKKASDSLDWLVKRQMTKQSRSKQ